MSTTSIASSPTKKVTRSKPKYLKASVARKIIEDIIPSSQIFTVTFDKKDGGGERVMNCRRGVTSYLAGGFPRATSSNTINVFDLKVNEYRSFCLDTIKSIKAIGITVTAS